MSQPHLLLGTSEGDLREGITLIEEHWLVIRFMREFHDEHQVAAEARFAIKALAETIEPDVDARRRMFQLFPNG